MVGPADWDDELVAHSASEGAGLGKGQMVRIGWHTATHKARLPQHEFSVVLVAQANRFAQSTGLYLCGDRFAAAVEASVR